MVNSKLKRKLIQVLALLIYNADVKSWVSGGVSHSRLKNVCVPGLNCYSCPGAISSCPLGAIQNTLANGRFPFLVTGLLMLFGTLLGRAVCAFLCPFGLLQELLYKIPFFKVKKTEGMLKLSRVLSLSKYAFLFALVLFLPLLFFFTEGIGSPFFCKYVCPSGTIMAGWPLVLLNESLREGLGFLFKYKASIAIIIIVLSLMVYRPFCKYICPLGAIYSFFNKSAIWGIKLDKSKCTSCGACVKECKMNALEVNDRECIRCGECLSSCHVGALSIVSLLKQKQSDN